MANIVTDGLIGYWHYKQGFKGDLWENISPDTKGKYNLSVRGAILQEQGLYFDGIDDYALLEPVPEINGEITVEIYIRNGPSQPSFPTLMGYGEEETKQVYLWGNRVRYRFQDGMSILSVSSERDTILFNSPHYLAFTVKREDFLKGYIDGVLVGETKIYNGITLKHNISFGALLTTKGQYTQFSREHILFIRIYNRVLTDGELRQNHTNGTDVGLAIESPIPTPPKVTLISIGKSKISPRVEMDISKVKFKFDKDVSQWEVRVLGSGQGTGKLADSGGAVSANTEITAEVDWTELYQEGQNRINIYGLGTDGSWTPYE